MLYAPNYYGSGEPTDSPGITTLLSRITDTIQTADEANTDQQEVLDAIGNLEISISKEDIREALNGQWTDLLKPTTIHVWEVTDYDPGTLPDPGPDLISNAE